MSGPVVELADVFCLHPVPDGAVAALRGLSLQVAAGERVVVHGPNGSGKTTLLRVLAGQQPISAGRAVVAGFDVGTAGRARAAQVASWRARRLGRVDQHPGRTLRPELDVLGNVALQLRLAGQAPRAARSRASEALAALRLGALARRRVHDLSGGEAQRVAVVAALAGEPVLVLADEPTGELDRHTADDVHRFLAEACAAAGAALVLVSHDPEAGAVADRVVRIRDGRLGETWRPGAGRELLVVDGRGWVRLPAGLWPGGRLPDAVAVRPAPGGLALEEPDGAAPAPGPQPTPSPASAPASAPRGGPGDVVATGCGLRRAFGGRVVLDGVDVTVRAGRLLVVRGPSGTGKSTLLRLLVGLDRPDAGSVHLAGQDLAALDRDGLARLRRAVAAVVGQDVAGAAATTVTAELELARAVRGLPADAEGDARALAALDLAALADRPVQRLSGGERQRVAVARVLVTGARLLVLDEPTSRLDEARAVGVATALSDAARAGAAVVVSTHDPALAAVADEVLDLS